MYGGSGDQWRNPLDPAGQLPYSSSALVISDPSAQNPVDMATSPIMQNGDKCKQAESIAAHSKKLEDDLHELGLKIKHHEDNIKYLQNLKCKLDESVVDMQVALGKYDKASFIQIKGDPEHIKSEEETIANILKHENSGGAILYRMKSQAESLSTEHPLTSDVIGIVATLGKIDDNNLSRLLSEYLGLETMLAVVCKTYEGVKALEAYNKDGSVNKSLGLHGFSASIGNPIADRFLVICLEDLRKDIELKFPTGTQKFNLPEGYLEIENGIKEAKWKRDRTCEDMKREQDLFARAKLNYEKKKQEVIDFLANSSSNAPKYPVGGGSNLR